MPRAIGFMLRLSAVLVVAGVSSLAGGLANAPAQPKTSVPRATSGWWYALGVLQE